MSISPSVGLEGIVDDITAILAEVIGEDFLLDVEVTMETTFSHDLELESIEFVAMAEKLQERYAGGVDFTAFLAGLEIDEILALSVGQLAGHVARSLSSTRPLRQA
jgi:acyl carrier protein